MYATAWLGCCQAREGGRHLINVKFLQLWNKMTIIIFLANKIMHNFQIEFDFVKLFLNQTYILVVFNLKTSKGILFWKINRFLRSTTKGSMSQYTKNWSKINYNFWTRFKFWLSLYSFWILTRTPFKNKKWLRFMFLVHLAYRNSSSKLIIFIIINIFLLLLMSILRRSTSWNGKWFVPKFGLGRRVHGWIYQEIN